MTAPVSVKIITRGEKKGTLRRWDKNSNESVKQFKTQLRRISSESQGNRCAYCVLPIGHDRAHRGTQLDHFIPWKKYPEWTFEVKNLILACGTCNEDRKGTYDPLLETSRIRPMREYGQLKFNIVHPFLDRVDTHLEGGYLDDGSYPEPIRGLSKEGIDTIRLFDLASDDMYQLWCDDHTIALVQRMPGTQKEKHRKIMDSLSTI